VERSIIMNRDLKIVQHSMSSTQSEILRIMRKEAMDDYIAGDDRSIFKVEIIDELNQRMAELSLESAKILANKVRGNQESKKDQ
jgi:hypothetical protein